MHDHKAETITPEPLNKCKVKTPFLRKSEDIFGEKDCVTKFEFRITQPNKEYINLKIIHTLEHLLSHFLRENMNGIVNVSPTGCQTGFYIITFNSPSYSCMQRTLENSLKEIVKTNFIPRLNEAQCSWIKHHDLNGAKKIAQRLLDHKNEWTTIYE